MLWRARGSAVSWADRTVGVPLCPASPCAAALPCAALPRPARGTYVRVSDSTGWNFVCTLFVARYVSDNSFRYAGGTGEPSQKRELRDDSLVTFQIENPKLPASKMHAAYKRHKIATTISEARALRASRSMINIPMHAFHERKRFTKTNRLRYPGQQPGTKSASRPADKSRMNQSSTERFVPPPVYIGIRLFVLPKSRSRQLSSMPWRARGLVVSWANRPVGVPSCRASCSPATPLRAAPLRPARGMSGFWTRQVTKYMRLCMINMPWSSLHLLPRSRHWRKLGALKTASLERWTSCMGVTVATYTAADNLSNPGTTKRAINDIRSRSGVHLWWYFVYFVNGIAEDQSQQCEAEDTRADLV